MTPTLVAVRDVAALMLLVTACLAPVSRGAVTIGFGAGAAWNLVNLALLSLWGHHVTSASEGGRRRWLVVTLLGIVKFPVLYGIGLWLLVSRRVEVLPFLAGFTAVLALVAARVAIGRR